MFRISRLDMALALHSIGFGLWLLMPMVSMASPAYRELLASQSEAVWGLLFFTQGLAHATSIITNGRRWWTPYARMFTASMIGSLNVVYALGFAAVDPASTAVYNYFALAVAAAVAVKMAYRDALTAGRIANVRG